MGTVIGASRLTYMTTDADFRAWGKGISDDLVAAGATKVDRATQATGSIDWTTVTRPQSNDSAAGWELFKFSDADQATKPVYIRIWYGSSNGSATFTSPQIWVQLVNAVDPVTGQNAVGALVSQQLRMKSYGSPTAGRQDNAFISCSPSRITLFSNISWDGQGQDFRLCIERPKNAAGVAQLADVAAIMFLDGNTIPNGSVTVLPVAAVTPSASANDYGNFAYGMNVANGFGGYTGFNSVIALSPFVIPFGKWLYGSPLLGSSSDINVASIYKIPQFGTTRTFMALHHGSGTPSRLLLPWE